MQKLCPACREGVDPEIATCTCDYEYYEETNDLDPVVAEAEPPMVPTEDQQTALNMMKDWLTETDSNPALKPSATSSSTAMPGPASPSPSVSSSNLDW
jgi:hypothetical protein